ncbi:glycosyltransferase family 4 protein [Luminiphilus sp.]|nr:glycosyltransferase family 4 protein [Luminiphilus sp.]
MIGLSPGIVKGVSDRGVKKSCIAMVLHGCNLNLFAEAWRPERVSEHQLLAVFTGTHGPANGLDAVLDAAAVLKEVGRDDISIALVGQGREKSALQARARAQSLDNVVFVDPVPKRQLVGLMAGAVIGLQVLRNVPAFYFGTSPNKFFDYISAGLPVLHNYPGWIADLVSVNDAGYFVPPDNPTEFAKALIAAADNFNCVKHKGLNAYWLAETQFSRRKPSEIWVSWVTETVQP